MILLQIKIKPFAIACLCSLFAFNSFAEEAQSTAPFEYHSDGGSTMANVDGSRIVTMKTNVQFTQGDLLITGDTAVLEFSLDTDDLEKVTVIGTPARYEQRLENSGELVEGDSETIYYFASDAIVEFIGDASLKQTGSTTNCVAIKYYADSELFDTTGPCSGVFSSQPN